MEIELYRATPGAVAGRLLVVIPGANQPVEELRDDGFLAAVRERGLDIDVALMSPQPAHLLDRSALAALRAEIVRPARSSTRARVWLAGISWGGFLALLYAADHSDELDGVCLLSPYLGNRMMTTELLRFESLASWSAATLDIHDELDEERRMWRYLAGRGSAAALIRYLGFGSEDRFAQSQRLLADQLPPQAVDVIAGGHDSGVWRQLWQRLTDRLAGDGAGQPS
jgi:pimeloyl-ACP methyl ester carboxylesterase